MKVSTLLLSLLLGAAMASSKSILTRSTGRMAAMGAVEPITNNNNNKNKEDRRRLVRAANNKESIQASTTQHARKLNSTTDSPQFAYIMEDGVLVVEAESVLTGDAWFVEDDISGFTGAGFSRFSGNKVNEGPPTATRSIFFKISDPGTYRLAIRSLKNDTLAPNFSNDCYTKLVGYDGYQGEHTKTYQKGKKGANKWSWKTHHEVSKTEKYIPYYDLEDVGAIYELQVSGRSKHFRMDRIVLYNEAAGVTKRVALALKRSESPLVPIYPEPEYHEKFFVDAGVFGEDESVIFSNKQLKAYSDFDANITGAEPLLPLVFQTHRYAKGGNFTYTLPGFQPETDHVITVGFAEIWQPNCVVGERTLSVSVMGTTWLSDLDVFATAGCFAAYNVSGTFESGADGKIEIAFIKGVENPFVSFIYIQAV